MGLPHAPTYRALAEDFTRPCAASDGHCRANRENVLTRLEEAQKIGSRLRQLSPTRGIFDLNDPPEAKQETSASATVYVRVPEVSKKRIDQAAKKSGQSTNVWAMGCLERCAAVTMYPPNEFEIDRAKRKVTHKPSGITFSFYEYTTEEDWDKAAPASYRERPDWDGDRLMLAMAAKHAAKVHGMKSKLL